MGWFDNLKSGGVRRSPGRRSPGRRRSGRPARCAERHAAIKVIATSQPAVRAVGLFHRCEHDLRKVSTGFRKNPAQKLKETGQ